MFVDAKMASMAGWPIKTTRGFAPLEENWRQLVCLYLVVVVFPLFWFDGDFICCTAWRLTEPIKNWLSSWPANSPHIIDNKSNISCKRVNEACQSVCKKVHRQLVPFHNSRWKNLLCGAKVHRQHRTEFTVATKTAFIESTYQSGCCLLSLWVNI